MKHAWLIAVLALVVACGDKKEQKQSTTPTKNGGTTKTQETDSAAAKKKADEARKAKQARREELNTKLAELKATIKDTEAKLDGLDAKHEEERSGVADLRKLRQRFVTKQRAMFEATSKATTMQKRFDAIKGVAEKAATGELKGLNDKMAEVEKRYRKALSGWKDSLEETAISRVHASPVKRKLDALRVIKKQWFAATPEARAGNAGASEKKIISDGFRAWLAEDKVRTTVVAEVLAQPGAPSGKTPDTYDFTELLFYVLMELHEDALDRQNIAVEKKELGDNANKLQAIEAEMEKLRNQIAAKMSAGGGDLETYEDLRSRLPAQLKKAETLQREVEGLREALKEVESLRERQDKEADELARTLEAAKKEQRKLRAELKRAG